MNRRSYLRLAGIATFAGLAGCSSDGSEGTTVEMTDDFRFDPETIEVSPGTTVEWENVGSVGHTVTAYEDRIPAEADYFASGDFDAESTARENLSEGMIGAGETYRHAFDVEGTYEYYCIPHEGSGMAGIIRVE